MNLVLDELASRSQTQIIVCLGLPGSPIDRIAKICADLFDTGNYYAYSSALGAYRHVFSLDIGVARSQDPLVAQQYMAEALHRSRVEQELLVLNRFQLLRAKGAVDEVLMRLLVSPGSAAVLGLFELSFEDEADPYELFPNLDMRVVPMEDYDERHALNTISTYYTQEWESRGFSLAGSALETLFEVEPTVYAHGHRKTLPYLATDLVQEAIDALSPTAGNINGTLLWRQVQTARENLEHLQYGGEVGELTHVLIPYLEIDSVAVRHFAEEWLKKVQAVRSAYTELSSFDNDFPEPEPPIELTRAIINATLFGSTRYRFRFVQAFKSRLKAKFPNL